MLTTAVGTVQPFYMRSTLQSAEPGDSPSFCELQAVSEATGSYSLFTLYRHPENPG